MPNSRDDEAIVSLEGRGPVFSDVVERRLSRRAVLKGAASVALATGLGAARVEAVPAPAAGLAFQPIKASNDPMPIVPKNYRWYPVAAWGDALVEDQPPFDAARLTAPQQEIRFGYNCDFVGFFPRGEDRGLLVVNHEYTNSELIFAGYDQERVTREQADVEMAAHGLSVVELERKGGRWQMVVGSRFNRRITANTPMVMTGPAASSPHLRDDGEDEARAFGTLNNCSGGKTPWGTVLSGEENFHQYFGNLDGLEAGPLKENHRRYNIDRKASGYRWEKHHERFDVAKNPTEPLRFGWVVEIDPSDPTMTPRKRTALGRFRHEAATVVICPDKRVAVYSGDDARFEYVYKFVSEKAYKTGGLRENDDLLDSGVLYAARFDTDGKGMWLRLVHGEGPLTEENGFTSQADVLLNTRRAADLLGATKMDRPEDIETSPKTGKVYIVCTKNDQRGADGRPEVNPANPRAENKHGHIIELVEEGGNHAAESFTWDLFLLCGDPNDPSTYFAGFPKDQVSPISSPDNITFDLDGNLWIATDGQPESLKVNDGLFAVPVEGAERGHLRQFFSSVVGSEVCGPEFTPDNTTLFIAVQHPGDGGTFDKPIVHWPGKTGTPQPTVIAIEAEDGGRIGSFGASSAQGGLLELAAGAITAIADARERGG